MPLTLDETTWYLEQIQQLDPEHEVVTVDRAQGLVHYAPKIQSDESRSKPLTPEEYVHALVCVLLVKRYGYKIDKLYHEKHIAHGSAGSKADELDILILDEDGQPYAAWELKSAEAYAAELERATEYQLFKTVPLLTNGAPVLIACATIMPDGIEPRLRLRCIDYRQHKDYDAWHANGASAIPEFPRAYREPDYVPYVRGGAKDLRQDCTTQEFRAVAQSFHNEFFSEHPDNQLFEDLLKCLLAKVHDEKSTRRGEDYTFQIEMPLGKPQSATEVFKKVNDLYGAAYNKYIEAGGADELDPRRFAPERVKSVVQQLEGMALTRGAALNADIMSAFFEEILRSGFKQDRGMYFTHDNLARFMIEAVGLRHLTRAKWRKATHPNNRLPYVIDPACGSGTFLLHAMQAITEEIRDNCNALIQTEDDDEFFQSQLSDNSPNHWARDFLYGMDAKFIMAVTAKLNMVLHGDGVAHIFKDDAFKPIGAYQDPKLRIITARRSVSDAAYKPPMCESFDVVISNPPFGVTLPAETRLTLGEAFSLPKTVPTEALFIERAFQLLRPGGRLAVVLPESILNAADKAVRMLLLRTFHLRAVVALPRNIFVDTPTLTSLIFAQKKTGSQIAFWDRVWNEQQAVAEAMIAAAARRLTRAGRREFATAHELQVGFLRELTEIVDERSWILKRGSEGGAFSFSLPEHTDDMDAAADYYRTLLRAPGFQELVDQFVFRSVTTLLDSEYACYAVSEVGFKLSRRKERVRENQLARFVNGAEREIPNLHFSAEKVKVKIVPDNPETVLDYVARDVVWE